MKNSKIVREGFLGWIFFFAVALILFPQKSTAGEAVLTGYGEIEVLPDYMSVAIFVSSECYPSALGVSSANDQVATKVLDILKSLADSSAGDEITATGGFVKRYSGVSVDGKRAICVNKFKKINKITFKTKFVSKYAQTFALLQDKVYGLGYENNSENLETPNSFLEMSQPEAGLTFEAKKSYERKVLGMALQDAREKLESTLILAGINKYKIINYTENSLPNPRHFEGIHRSISEGGDPSPAPIEIGKMKIIKYLDVRFEYTGGDLNFN